MQRMSDYPRDTDQHRQLRDSIAHKVYPWRRYLVAVDGADGAGKSTLARYLAWQLGMPAIETDAFLEQDAGALEYRDADLEAVIRSRLEANRPVIVEGVRILHTLHTLGLQADCLVWVEKAEWTGTRSLSGTLEEYRREYKPMESADLKFEW